MKLPKLFDNNKKAVLGIVAFAVLFFWMRSSEAGTLELGPSPKEGFGLVYTERLAEKWDVGLVLVSNQTKNDKPVGNNGGVFVQRVTRYKNIEMGLGVAHWMDTSKLIGGNLTFSLSVGYRFNDTWSLGIRHWSTAGTTDSNGGQDLLLVGWRF